MNSNCDIAVVIVTYNRIVKLKKTLDSYCKQSLKPEYLIIVDNASTDGTSEFLDKWKLEKEKFCKIIIHAKSNLGGSGGFHLGEEAALKLEVNWILIADDDAYPNPDYLERLITFIQEHKNERISAVCGKVLQHNSFDNEHRVIKTTPLNGQWKRKLTKQELSMDYLRIDLSSYVGILINKEALKKVGLVNKDYFIWLDDFEHCVRLHEYGDIYCIPSCTIVHDCSEGHDEKVSWKTYYGYRNQIDLFRRHYSKQFLYFTLLMIVKAVLCPLKGKSFTEAKVRLNGIFDGIFQHLGKNDKYKPGWKP